MIMPLNSSSWRCSLGCQTISIILLQALTQWEHSGKTIDVRFNKNKDPELDVAYDWNTDSKF